MKIALYNTKYSINVPWEVTFSEDGEEDRPCDGEWIRATEIVDVTFPALPVGELVEKQLAAIDKQEQAARETFQRVLNEFKAQRANLQALTHVEAA